MPQIQQNLAQIRRMLDSPSPQQPGDVLLFDLISDQVVHHQSQLQNSSAAWSVNSWLLGVSQGNEDYLITATDFGKPFLCYTEDSTDPYLPRVEVPFAKLQNVDQFYSGPRQTYSTGSNIFTASVFSFYRQSDAWYVRVAPVPGGSSSYRIWYETAPTAPGSLGDTPGLSPFHHLIRVQTAIAALPYCAWGDVRADSISAPHAAAWERKTRSLALALGFQREQFEKQFETYLGTLEEAGVERRLGFGDDYLTASDWSADVGVFGPNQWGIG